MEFKFLIEHFIKYLKSLINNDYRENLKDFFLEKEIDIWNEFEKNKEIDLEFVTNGLKWYTITQFINIK